MASAPGPQPQANFPWVDSGGRPSLAYALYMAALDATVRALTRGFFGAPVQLIDAANDAAAATAGVAIGQLYKNGSVVQIRVT